MTLDDRIRIRCTTEDRSRWAQTAADYDVEGPTITTLRALMDVYEDVPSALDAATSEYIDPDDQIVIYPEPETAKRWRYFNRHFDSHEKALRALLDLWENNPDDVPTLDV